jgi:type II restriction/modification system DNA methylase subunit YeeA
METAPLKSFATWARTTLIREVAARIAVILAPVSPERVEQPGAVAALEKAIRAAGAGDTGRAAVADKVAYTWFNRIIALRFMDANGYTGIGVVSPERGREGGQPEVLAEAKRGNIDITVVTNKRNVESITSLLNGTRRSHNPQGEAYAFLLAEYCRHWNRSMRFMFEREGDYTELLIPANLLADGSVLAHAVSVLTEEVCQDVEVIGWLYQFYVSERKDEVFAGFKKNKKAGAAEIPAATQLFTPHWIVRYLVENSLGRLWLLNRPTSRLADQMDYYIAPVDEETDYLKVASPEELTIIDPACGSGHMLTYAFDLLYAIYEEEGYAPSDIPRLILANNLYGTEIDPRAGALAAFALTMKARARQRTFFDNQIEPNIYVLEPISFTPSELDILVSAGGDLADEEPFWNQFQNVDTFGSLISPRESPIPLRKQTELVSAADDDLITSDVHTRARRVIKQAECLSQRYSVVVANPPYMGLKNMNPALSGYLVDAFPDSKADLMTAFMERCRGLTVRNGYWAMINIQSWMFLGSFERLRSGLVNSNTIVSLVHLGRGMFGSDFGTVAFVFANRYPHEGCKAVYRRLFEKHVSVRQLQAIEALFLAGDYNRYVVAQSDLAKVPGYVFGYWLTSAHLSAFEHADRLDKLASPRQGLATADNGRFVRYWYEVSDPNIGYSMGSRQQALASGRKWFPYNKGGDFRRWYGNQDLVVNWARDGAEIRAFGRDVGRVRSRAQNMDYYFSSSVSWSKISSGRPAFRFYPTGFIFDVAGTSLFAATNDLMLELLAYCNSTVALSFLEALSPTVNFEVGHIAALPVQLVGKELRNRVTRLVELAKQDWDSWETSWGFTSNALMTSHRPGGDLRIAYTRLKSHRRQVVDEALELEAENNNEYAQLFDLRDVQLKPVSTSLWADPAFRYGGGKSDTEYDQLVGMDEAKDLVSYAVGCMFGRYCLNQPGLVLANQGDTLRDYLAKVPNPSFMPDKDNVIPIVDGDWFDDDIVARFRRFLRAAFGEQHFEANLRFVTESVGAKDLRDYFLKSFYTDHVQRYKKRPIYWLFSSPKGSFNALIYLHRYTPSTASTVLNEYLREFKAKLEASRQHHERLAAGGGTLRGKAAAQKEVDRLRMVLLELDEYEHDVLYPLATQQVQIDLDDGVKANYPKFGAALKKIPGLEASDE